MSKLVCFGLPRDIQEREVERIFDKFGKIDRTFVRDAGSTTMAFVEFFDSRDCDDAVRDRDGYEIDGCRLRVERSRPKGEGKKGRSDSRGRGRGGRRDSRRRDSRGRGGRGGGKGDYGYGKKGGGKSSKGGVSDEYARVVIEGVPDGCSWQDLKDFLRPAAAPQFADVVNGRGIAGYDREDDCHLVKDKLDGEKMRSRHGGEGSVTISVVPAGQSIDAPNGGARKPSRSPSRKASRSPSRKRSERRSRSRSAEKRSERRSRSRSAGY